MPKIRITRGVYGHSNGFVTEPKDKNSDPFDVSEKKAQELIAAGVAELATALKPQADKPIRYTQSLAPVNNLKNKSEQQPECAQDFKTDEEDAEKPQIEYSIKNTRPELVAIAHDRGLDIPEGMIKSEIIVLLDESFAGEAPGIDDDGVID